ncbi:hypothetical protein GF358_03400 [Candidatus Woesearchaeota archaeon]|nr:hypothetical protein [Candidatus Woesearchaeota archaeon]
MYQKNKEDPWSGYSGTEPTNIHKRYSTGTFKRTEEGWRPVGTVRANNNPDNKKSKSIDDKFKK